MSPTTAGNKANKPVILEEFGVTGLGMLTVDLVASGP